MKVNLINITPDAEKHIAEVARVSSSRQNKREDYEGLIRYLINHKHWSPFEHAYATFEIETSKAIGIQLIRHRSFTFQEFSQRYAVSESFSTKRDARKQHPTNRQLSERDSDVSKQAKAQEVFNEMQAEVARVAKDHYEMALNTGIAKEQARALLPEGLTETTLYMAGTLRSWIHYCELRRGHGTQIEHMQVADLCWEVLKTHFAEICAAVEEIGNE